MDMRHEFTPDPGLSAQTAAGLRKVLLVEDDRVAQLMMQATLAGLGCSVEVAMDGAAAYLMLRENPDCADVVLTDRFMPMLDGLGLTRRLKREPATAKKPVVMMTGADDNASVAEGVAAGVFHYLTKPVDSALLAPVLDAAFAQVERQKQAEQALARHQSGFALATQMQFRLARAEDVASVASLLSSMAGDADRACAGLVELIGNSVEHGLLRMGGAAKAQLRAEGRWEAELAARGAQLAASASPAFVEAAGERLAHGWRFLVRDPGGGFNWRQALRADPTKAAASSGRGLSRAAALFSKLEFNEAGNLVVATLEQGRRRLW